MSKNQRIIFFSGSMGKGGAERVLSILSNELCKRGWQVHIVMLLKKQIDYVLDEKIQITDLSRPKKGRIQNVFYWLKNIRKLIIKTKPRIIVSFFARINLLVEFANIGLKIPSIVSERNDPSQDGRSLFEKTLTYLLYRRASLIVFQTQHAKMCFPKYIQKRGIIIQNPIEAETQYCGEKSNTIVNVGRLSPQKDQVTLIKGFALSHKKHQEMRLEIFGSGEMRENLQNLIKELDLEKSIKLVGNVENVQQLLSQSRFFILSSKYEGLSNALMEAMAIGMPVISTKCAGSDELITDSYNGILIEIGDFKGLSSAIEKLWLDEPFAQILGKNAGVSAINFSKEKIILKWLEIFEKVSK